MTPRVGARRRDALVFGCVLASAVALAGLELARFLDDPAALHDGLAHDRHEHYRNAQRLAIALVHGDLLGWLRALEQIRSWPPLHGVIASLPVALAGVDWRAAILPSLLGQVLTVAFGFLAARRAAPSFGNAGGLVAALFLAASPAHIRYSGDVMLESLGAALTLACLYCALGTLPGRDEEARARAARWLGLALTGLLFEKYNYYVLALVGIAAGALTHPRFREATLALARGFRPARAGAAELRHPLNWLALAFAGLAIGVAITGGGSFEVAGRRFSMTRAQNLIPLVYLPLFLRALAWWWRGGLTRLDRVSPLLGELARWHAAPLAVWFALPRRLSTFIGYVGSSHTPTPSTFVANLGAHATALGTDYHAHALGVVLASALVFMVTARLRALGPAARLTLAFVAAAAALTLVHPYALSRFLHSWIGAGWVLAGLGASASLAAARSPGIRATVGGALALTAGLYAALAFEAAAEARARAAPSVLALTNAYLEETAELRARGEPLALVSTFPIEELAAWTYAEEEDARPALDVYTPPRIETEGRRGHLAAWLERTPAAAVIVVDVEPPSPWYTPGFDSYEETRPWLAELSRSRRTTGVPLAVPGTTVTLWRR